jgi:hypothetical protein
MLSCLGFLRRKKKPTVPPPLSPVDAKKKANSFVKEKGKINFAKSGPELRRMICALSPALAKKFLDADELCMRLFGHPLLVEAQPNTVAISISYIDGHIYLSPGLPRGQIIGAILFELNNALKAEDFKKVEQAADSGDIMEADAADYGIKDEWTAERFRSLESPEERRALAQEYLEWEHMVNETIPEQKKLAEEMELPPDASPWVTYLDLTSKEEWATFEGYMRVSPEHHDFVLKSIRESKERKK